MHFVFSPFTIPLFFSAFVAAAVAVYTWKQRVVHASAFSLSWLMVDVMVWLLAYGLELLGSDQATKEFWEIIVTVSQAFIGPTWLIFAIQYAGLKEWLSSKKALLLLLPGIVTTAMAATNQWHHLLWAEATLHVSGPFLAIFPTPGPWFWALAIYRYIYVLVGTSLVLITLVRSPAGYRRSGILIAAGGLMPLLGNSLHIFDLVHVLWLDLGPFAFMLSGLMLSLGLFTYRLLDILPLAQRAIFESMPDGVIVLDSQDKVVDINPTGRQMLGFYHSIGNVAVTDILPDALRGYIRDPTAAGSEFSMNIGERPSGEALRWLRPSMSPLTDGRGQFLGRLLVFHDVTEAHSLEELREDLTRMMVHDLRNPLSVVYGSVELLSWEAAEKLDDRERKLVDMIMVSNMQCLEIANRILDVHLLESGQMPLELESTSLAALIDQAVQQMSPLADMHRLQLVSDSEPDLPPVQADVKLLGRVLQNFIGNAIKFTPAGGMIRVHAQKESGNLRVQIADTGPGIPTELQRRLFQKYVTGSTKHRGSGLGLAFCKLAIEAHGGHIWVESREGQGSTFYFTLPRESRPTAAACLLPRQYSGQLK